MRRFFLKQICVMDSPRGMTPPPLCLVLPPGLQALLTAVGLVRKLCATRRRVLVCMEVALLPHLQSLFHGTPVTFWFDEPDPEARAAALGYRVVRLSPLPKEMYEAVHLAPRHMHSSWSLLRDSARENELLERVTGAHGQTYVLTWRGERGDAQATLLAGLLPQGIPVVDAGALEVSSPFDLCALMEHALQVHAVDSWFLTLADLVGGHSKKYCHCYASALPASTCRKKYRQRVSLFVGPAGRGVGPA